MIPSTMNTRVITIVGPTAVGKTALSLALAVQLGGEIICADSRQVYRQMEIGTAKPTAAERTVVPHHLFDIVEPDEDFSLASYIDAANAAIAAIVGRGALPLLVGGTGQYLAALLEGWQIPRVAPQPELRARLEQEAATSSVEALHARLAQIDPAAAAGIMPTNGRRIIRALEVYEVTGQPISLQQTKIPPPYDILTIWLTLPVEQLYPRIDARVDAMMAAGLLAEVRGLVERGYGFALPSMSSLGYREFQPYLAGEATVEACVQRLKFNTHAFARRQPAWFRRLPGVTQFAAQPPVIEQIYSLLTSAS